MTDEPSSDNVKRHYLKLREGAEVPPGLRTYCDRSTFSSYPAADARRKEKLAEYDIRDSDIIEIKFRR